MRYFLREYGRTILIAVITIVLIALTGPLKGKIQNSVLDLMNKMGGDFESIGSSQNCECTKDLTGTTWYFNDEIVLTDDIIPAGTGNSRMIYLDFNGYTNYNSLSVESDTSIYYYTEMSSGQVYGNWMVGYQWIWMEEPNPNPDRTITITGGEDVKNADVIEWFEKNATLKGGKLETCVCKKPSNKNCTTESDLKGTTWEFNSQADVSAITEWRYFDGMFNRSEFNLTFEDNGSGMTSEYIGLQLQEDGSVGFGFDYYDSVQYNAVYYPGYNDGYGEQPGYWYYQYSPYTPVIHITGGTDTKDENLIAWFKDNATLIDGELEKTTCKEKETGKCSVRKNLTDTVWEIYGDLGTIDYNEGDYKINFVYGEGTQYQGTGKALSIGAIDDSGYGYGPFTPRIYYWDTEYPDWVYADAVYASDSGYMYMYWRDSAYQTIRITGGHDVENADLISFLENNANLISGELEKEVCEQQSSGEESGTEGNPNLYVANSTLTSFPTDSNTLSYGEVYYYVDGTANITQYMWGTPSDETINFNKITIVPSNYDNNWKYQIKLTNSSTYADVIIYNGEWPSASSPQSFTGDHYYDADLKKLEITGGTDADNYDLRSWLVENFEHSFGSKKTFTISIYEYGYSDEFEYKEGMTWNDWLNSNLCKSGNWFNTFRIQNGWYEWDPAYIMADMFNGFESNYICEEWGGDVTPGSLISENRNYVIYTYQSY